MPLIAQAVSAVMTCVQLYPVPGTIKPMNVAGRIWPVCGFRADRVVPESTG